MIQRVLSFIGMLSIFGLIVATAFAVDKKANNSTGKRIDISKIRVPSDMQRKLLVPLKLDDAVIIQSGTSEAILQDTIFTDDFEGGQPQWQATGSWGSTAQGGGLADEDHSDWGLDMTNFNSPTTSWHESGVSLLSTDLLLSPIIALPTTVTGGEPLARARLELAMDYDQVDGTHLGVYVYAGTPEELWAFDTGDPGTGASSWLCPVPAMSPYDEFIRQFVTTPDIDLTSATAPATLDFQYKSIAEPDFDYNKVDVSTDNFETYLTVFSTHGGVGTGGTPTWTSASTISLDAFIGSTIKIRFGTHGDYGFVEPGAIFALDAIDVSDAGGTLFSDDGGDTPTTMTTVGFNPGNNLTALLGTPQPTPNWMTIDAGVNLLDGAGGTIAPGDSIRIGFMFASDGGAVGGSAPGRGVYIDDIVITGEAITDDAVAVNLRIPHPIKVGDAVIPELCVLNNGSNDITSFSWSGTFFEWDPDARTFGPQAGPPVTGSFSGSIAQDSTVYAPSTGPILPSWTPPATGVYAFRAIVNLAADQNRSNDTTIFATDSPEGLGDNRYAAFYVCDENILFSAELNDLGDDPTAGSLVGEGFMVVSNSPPGVETWHTSSTDLFFGGHAGAYVIFDSLGRPQDEDLIIPNLDFSYITSDATLSFKGLGVMGFSFSRFRAEVSNDGGHSYHTVFERIGGTDPQTGVFYSGPAGFTFGQRPAVVDITPQAAGHSNVWIRFKYVGFDDGDYTVWRVVVCGAGILAANLQGVTDIPNDNGKQVRLTWDASPNDGQINGVPITEYGVWRGVVGGAAGGDVIQVADRSEMISNIDGLKPGTRFHELQTDAEWDFVGSVLAHSDSIYNFVAPTLEDSVLYPFMVSAHTANPLVFANSNTASGMSFDNLAPGVPPNFAAVVNPGPVVDMTWDPVEDEDFAFFALYKDGVEILRTIELFANDPNVAPGQTITYTLTAFDFANNESDAAEATVMTTGVGEGVEIPTVYSIANNYPNPFNPSTVIRFGVPTQSSVSLKIYNVLGQEIATLVDEVKSAGYFTVQWNGTNQFGSEVASGIYLYLFEAKGVDGSETFKESKKMLLLE